MLLTLVFGHSLHIWLILPTALRGLVARTQLPIHDRRVCPSINLVFASCTLSAPKQVIGRVDTAYFPAC